MPKLPDNEGLQHLLGLVPDMLCVANTDGMFVYVNAEFSKALGWTPAELTSQPFLRLIHPDDVASTIEQLEALREGVPTVDFENRYLHRDGSYRVLNWRSRPRINTDYIYASARDVTELRGVQKQLEHTEQILRHAAENAKLGGWEYDLKTGEAVWSEQVSRIHETPIGWVPTTIDEGLSFFPPHARIIVRTAVEHAIATGTGWDVTCRFIAYSGREKWIRTCGNTLFNENGDIVRLRGAFQDVTEDRAREQQQRDFMATVSHELRTPLMSVVSALQILNEAPASEIPAELTELLRVAHRNGDRVVRAMNELLDHTSVSRGHITLSAQRIPTADLWDRAFEIVRPIAEYHQTKIVFDDGYDGPVFCDRRRATQVLSAMLTHVLRTSDSGQLACRLTRVGDFVRFTIEDDSSLGDRGRELVGPGLGDVDVGHAQASRAGLNVTRRLVELQGGCVGAAATETDGAVLWFELPVPPPL